MFDTLLNVDAFQSYYFFCALVIVPFSMIFRKVGFTPWLSVVLLLPYSGLFLSLGILAFKRWPNAPVRTKKPKKEKKMKV